MKAIQFNFSISRYILGLVVGRLYLPFMWSGLACLKYTDVVEPGLPNGEWVRIKTRFGGICGTDNQLIHLASSPSLSVFGSFPFVVGHENVGTIAELGSEVRGFEVGERVVVDPTLACIARGLAPCEFCRAGVPQLCVHKTEGALAPGIQLGACRDTGGSWSPSFVAHYSQLVRIPDSVSDVNAVLLEPFASSLHAAVTNMPADDETVLVIGAGMIGLGVVAALRALGSKSRIVVVARHKTQQDLAAKYGADLVLASGRNQDEEFAHAVGGKLLKPVIGKPVLVGGAHLVFDCVGSSTSLSDSIRYARALGRVVLAGLATFPEHLDWTPIWMKELHIVGVLTYGEEEWRGMRMRTFDLALDLMRQGKVDLGALLTHRFRLNEYGRAFETVNHRGREHAIKVVFEFPKS